MRLYHFSEAPDIERFEPRPVRMPATRPQGREWLNGSLVWAIDEWHQPMYLFPRECPRILLWRLPHTTEADRAKWLGDSPARIIAHIEEAWLDRFTQQVIYRYELPSSSFEDLQDAGMWISRYPVSPLRVDVFDDLRAELAAQEVELRVLPRLTPLRGAWQSSLHVSGIRLRNALDWS